MSDYNVYSTGWYSISPSFAWWNSDPNRVAQIQARREAKRVAEKARREKEENARKVPQGTISIYA
jgi:hypothetical protein